MEAAKLCSVFTYYGTQILVMGRILFLLMTLTDLISPHPLSLGNHGPLVRRKDLEKFRNSFSKKPAVCKPLLIFTLARGCLGLPITTDSLFSSRYWETRL